MEKELKLYDMIKYNLDTRKEAKNMLNSYLYKSLLQDYKKEFIDMDGNCISDDEMIEFIINRMVHFAYQKCEEQKVECANSSILVLPDYDGIFCKDSILQCKNVCDE